MSTGGYFCPGKISCSCSETKPLELCLRGILHPYANFFVIFFLEQDLSCTECVQMHFAHLCHGNNTSRIPSCAVVSQCWGLPITVWGYPCSQVTLGPKPRGVGQGWTPGKGKSHLTSPKNPRLHHHTNQSFTSGTPGKLQLYFCSESDSSSSCSCKLQK